MQYERWHTSSRNKFSSAHFRTIANCNRGRRTNEQQGRDDHSASKALAAIMAATAGKPLDRTVTHFGRVSL
jgi:hypothetical protein